MFNYGAVKNERLFEENINALNTAKKFMQAILSPTCIKEREYSTSAIDNITELQGFLHTLVNPQEDVNALNVINPIDEPTGNELQLNMDLKSQAQLVDILVQNLCGVMQGVLHLADKDNNYSKPFEKKNRV